MAPKKSSRTRKVSRAKANRKASIRTNRKAPGLIFPPGAKRLVEIY